MRFDVIVAATAMLSFGVATASAQDVCLSLNRVFSTKVLDNKTIVATDKQGRKFTVHMAQRCVALDRFAQLLTFRPASGLGSEMSCIRHGDTVGYSLPGDPAEGERSITIHGPQSQLQCTIDSVTPGAPPDTAS